jgi:hypothetical protein
MIVRMKTRTAVETVGRWKVIRGRIGYRSKAGVLFGRLDGPLANILQGGLQEQKTVGGDTGEKVGELDVEVSAKDDG